MYRAIEGRLRPSLHGLRYLVRNPASGVITLHVPALREPNPDERDVVARIFRAFRAMKTDQRGAAAVYHPSSLWRDMLERRYAPLTSALEREDLRAFHFFLSNFGVWPEYLGIDSPLIRHYLGSPLTRRYLQNDVFHRQLQRWRRFYNGRKPIACLRHPTHGNQAGASVENVFVGQEHVFFDEIYASLLAGLLRDVDHPVIGELGGGYGEFAHLLLQRLQRSTYVDFDLPETLCLAAYYLMLVYPERRILLYGEAPYSADAHDRYDLILMPCYEIAKLGTDTTDLFVNKNSLGEMTMEAVQNYVACLTKATRYFFHVNHDAAPEEFEDRGRGALGYEYGVEEDAFTLLFRYPDLDHLLRRGWEDPDSDIVVNLYERRAHRRARASR